MYSIKNKAAYCILLSMLLLLCNSVFAFAEESKTISLSGGSAHHGDSIKVEVLVDNPQSLSGIQCTISYDNTKLEVDKDDIVFGNLKGFTSEKNVIKEKSYLKFSAVSTKGIDTTSEVVLFSINFDIKSDAALGSTPVKIDYVFASTDDLNEIKMNMKDAVINITSNSNPGGSNLDSGSGQAAKPITKPITDPVTNPITEETEHKFTDTENYDWAKSSIEFLAKNNIMKGISENSFSPNSNIKRADYMLIIIRMLGIESQSVTENFSDVDENKYYYNALGVAKTYGFTNGIGENIFDPEGEISREDLFVMTYRILIQQNIIDNNIVENEINESLNKFHDYNDVSEYAQTAIAKLVSMGLIEGSNDMINPKGKATRAETAVFVERIYRLLQNKQ